MKRMRKAQLKEVSLARKWIYERATWLKNKNIPQWKRYLNYSVTEICMEDYKNDKLYLLEDDENNILGLLSYGDAEDIDKKLWDDWEDVKFIHRVIINKDFEGNKNGEYMVNWAKERANKDGCELRLNCVDENKYLYNYYKRLGFKCCGHKLGYFLFKG